MLSDWRETYMHQQSLSTQPWDPHGKMTTSTATGSDAADSETEKHKSRSMDKGRYISMMLGGPRWCGMVHGGWTLAAHVNTTHGVLQPLYGPMAVVKLYGLRSCQAQSDMVQGLFFIQVTG